jgi:hypothetical protein
MSFRKMSVSNIRHVPECGEVGSIVNDVYLSQIDTNTASKDISAITDVTVGVVRCVMAPFHSSFRALDNISNKECRLLGCYAVWLV